jgi:hypothetical protein
MKKLTLTVLALAGWAVLSAAVTPGAAIASKDQIVAAYAGNTLYEDAPTYEWAAFYDPDGKARGRGWNLLGSETAEGAWRVTDVGLFCVTWNRKNWAGGTENCYRIEIAGKQTVLQHVSGEADGDRTLVIKNGNPYNL